MMKTEIEMYERPPVEVDAIRTKVAGIRTRGEARAYIASVMEQVGIIKEQRRSAELALRRAPE